MYTAVGGVKMRGGGGEGAAVPREPLREEGVDEDVMVFKKQHSVGVYTINNWKYNNSPKCSIALVFGMSERVKGSKL